MLCGFVAYQFQLTFTEFESAVKSLRIIQVVKPVKYQFDVATVDTLPAKWDNYKDYLKQLVKNIIPLDPHFQQISISALTKVIQDAKGFAPASPATQPKATATPAQPAQQPQANPATQPKTTAAAPKPQPTPPPRTASSASVNNNAGTAAPTGPQVYHYEQLKKKKGTEHLDQNKLEVSFFFVWMADFLAILV